MDNILVINFTRMGDIIQTGPLIAGLRERHPDAYLSLLVASSFSGIAKLLPEVDEVLEWDQDRSVGVLLDGEHSLAQQTAYYRNWLHSLGHRSWDLVINVTHSKDSAVLTRLLGGKETRGISIQASGLQWVSHSWAKYFFCVTGNRAVNQFNLVDIYRKIGELRTGEGQALRLQFSPEASAHMDELLASSGLQGPLVVLQPGASKENRRWPIPYLADAARRIHATSNASFILVGSKAERDIAQELEDALDGLPTLNLAGRTSLEELTALCDKCDLLLTNDTGTLHVAAARGLRSVSLFLATALPWETGPWLEGCLILHTAIDCAPCSHHVICPHVMCREWLRPDSVAAASLELLARGGHCDSPGADWRKDPQLEIWESVRDGQGLLDLRSLKERGPTLEEVTGRLYRLLWTSRTGDAAAEFARWLDSWLAPVLSAEVLNGIESTLTDIGRMEALAAKGMLAVNRIVKVMIGSRDPGEMKAATEEIAATDDSLFEVELSRPELRPLGVMFRFDKEGLDEGAPLDEMNQVMLGIYSSLHDRCREMRKLCQMALESSLEATE